MTPRLTQRLADLIEDVELMLTGAESLAGAAARLAMTEQALADTLTRAGRSDLVTRLRGRRPTHLRPAGDVPAYVAAFDALAVLTDDALHDVNDINQLDDADELGRGEAA